MTTRKTSEERRTEITDAAMKILGERGLREFTAVAIAREVGIKDGTIFRHFKDMSAIAGAVLGRLEEVLEAAPRLTGEPIERLQAFVMSGLHAVSAQPALQSLLFSDQLAQAVGAQGPRRVAALRNRGREIVRSCLREAAAKGQLRDGLDIEGAVVLVTGTVMGFLFAAKDGALPAGADIERRCWQTLRSLLEQPQVLP